MLVLISDTHLTDGSSGETINSDAFAIFRKQLSNLAYAASFRADHSYRPIERLHLVLLGDILDVIRSSGWLTNGSTVRPWTDVGKPAFAQKVEAITQTILKHNSGSLAILKSLSRDRRVTVPKTAKPQVTPSGEREMVLGDPVPVEVLTYYQVGNHDWFYHLPGPAFDAIRSAIVDAMGLVNDPNAPFPFDPEECSALATAYRQHSVLARHGDLYDPFNFEGDRDASSLGDAIVVELLNRFPAEVQTQMGGVLPPGCIQGLRDVDNVRPLPLIPVWVDGLLQRTCANQGQIDGVKEIWDGLVDQFLANPFVGDRRSPWNPFDNVHQLEYALKFSKGVSLHALGELAEWVADRSQGQDGPFYRYALKEKAYQDRSCSVENPAGTVDASGSSGCA